MLSRNSLLSCLDTLWLATSRLSLVRLINTGIFAFEYRPRDAGKCPLASKNAQNSGFMIAL